MGYYIEIVNNGYHYWEGAPKPLAPVVIEVPRRPSPDHVWNGSAWEIPAEIVALRKEEAAESTLLTEARLIKILLTMMKAIEALAKNEPIPPECIALKNRIDELLSEENERQSI